MQLITRGENSLEIPRNDKNDRFNTEKITKTDIINILHTLKKVRENRHYEKRNGRYKKKTQIGLV